MKIKKHIMIFGTLALFASCDVLDQEPVNSISDEGVVTNQSSAVTALNGAYHSLASGAYYGTNGSGAGIAVIAAIASDNEIWAGSYNFLGEFDDHSYKSDNQAVKLTWYGIYSAVSQANKVIDLVSALGDNVISISEKKRIVAEATVIRSLAFFDLARLWGNVPLIKKSISSPSEVAGIVQSSQTETYKTVIEDVLSVYDDLSDATKRGRIYISKSVADAFLARVYLYQQDWANAEKYSTKVIDQTNLYQLVSIQDWLNNKQTAESVFELAYTTSSGNSQYHLWQIDGGGRHEIGVATELYQLITNPSIGGDRAILVKDQSEEKKVANYYVCTLYHRASTNDDPVYVFRLAEQYLIRAEARVQKADSDLLGAISDLNKIRERSHVADYQGDVNKESVLKAIEDERRIELAFEPHRWFDLIRTGKAVDVLNLKSYQQILPIPNQDILADQDLKQNPDY